MFRITFFILQAILAGFVVLWLVRHPGMIDIDWLDYHLEMPIALFLGAAFLVFLTSVFFFKILRAIWLIPGKFRDRYNVYDRKKAHVNLMAAISAYENENLERAYELLNPALQNLETKPIATFFASLIAQKQGKISEVQTYLTELTRLPGGESLGYQRLITQEYEKGKNHNAADYARQALPYIAYAPKLGNVIFDTFLSCGLLEDAEQAFQKIAHCKLLPKEKLMRLGSKLASAKSQAALDLQKFQCALQEARKAYDICPELEQALLYARLMIIQNQSRQARKLLEKTWKETPDPKIIDLYFTTYDVLDPFAKYQMVEKLVQENSSHPTSLLARARAAMTAELWGVARSYLQEYQDHYPEDHCFLTLMAEYEQRANHDTEAALRWLTK